MCHASHAGTTQWKLHVIRGVKYRSWHWVLTCWYKTSQSMVVAWLWLRLASSEAEQLSLEEQRNKGMLSSVCSPPSYRAVSWVPLTAQVQALGLRLLQTKEHLTFPVLSSCSQYLRSYCHWGESLQRKWTKSKGMKGGGAVKGSCVQWMLLIHEAGEKFHVMDTKFNLLSRTCQKFCAWKFKYYRLLGYFFGQVWYLFSLEAESSVAGHWHNEQDSQFGCDAGNTS